jgi:hypothetical protein
VTEGYSVIRTVSVLNNDNQIVQTVPADSPVAVALMDLRAYVMQLEDEVKAVAVDHE